MGEGHVHGQAPLRRPNVDERLVVTPRELLGKGDRRAHAAARHARQKAPQALWVTIQRGEHILGSHDFVLGSAGAQGGGEGPPEPILPGIGHFQHATDVGRLGPIKVQDGLGRIPVVRPVALHHAQGHEGIEEVPRLYGQKIEMHQFSGYHRHTIALSWARPVVRNMCSTKATRCQGRPETLLPEQRNRVRRELRIVRHHGQTFLVRLGDEEAVEGIPVVQGKVVEDIDMFEGHR